MPRLKKRSEFQRGPGSRNGMNCLAYRVNPEGLWEWWFDAAWEVDPDLPGYVPGPHGSFPGRALRYETTWAEPYNDDDA